jgi:hypothetical protein
MNRDQSRRTINIKNTKLKQTNKPDIKEHFNDKEVSGEEDISSIQINKGEGWSVVEFTTNQGKKT